MSTFDLRNCVTYENRIFAWDTRTKSIVEIEMVSISVAEAPEEAVKALLIAAGRDK